MRREINFLIDNIDPDYGITNNVFGKIEKNHTHILEKIIDHVFSGFTIKYIPSYFYNHVNHWIYPILFSTNNYVYLNSLFNFGHDSLSIYDNIPKQIVKELKNKKGKLLIIICEPFPDIRQFVRICNSKFNDVLFMTIHHTDAPNFFRINTFPLDIEYTIRNVDVDDISTYPNRNFSMFLRNYNETFERKFVLHYLEKNNLLSKGFVSAENRGKNFNTVETINANLLFDNIKLTFNSQDKVFNYLPIKEGLEKSLFNIIIETEYFYVDHMIITEKIYRCFKYKKPFIIFSQHNIIKHLNDMGFKTFSPVFNENYDKCSDPYKRFNEFLKEVKRLGSKSFNTLDREINELKNSLEHNKNLLTELEEKTKNEIFRIVNSA
jgi:hypothetical protein